MAERAAATCSMSASESSSESTEGGGATGLVFVALRLRSACGGEGGFVVGFTVDLRSRERPASLMSSDEVLAAPSLPNESVFCDLRKEASPNVLVDAESSRNRACCCRAAGDRPPSSVEESAEVDVSSPTQPLPLPVRFGFFTLSFLGCG